MLAGTWAWSTDGSSMTSYMDLAYDGTCGFVDYNFDAIEELEFCNWKWEWVSEA